ncbi:unnamed protein product [Alopecurus aequalis]
METKPLLTAETPADPSPPPSPPLYSSRPLPSSASLKNQEAVASAGKKKEQKSWVRGWIAGWRGSTEASGGINAGNPEHVLDIDMAPPSSSSPATTSPSGMGAEERRDFLSWVRSCLHGREGRERNDKVQTLIQRAEDFAGGCSGHCTLADPAAEMTEALRKFAAAPNAATSASLGLAAAALAKTAGSDKLEQDHARVAKLIASEATALATSGQGANRPTESSLSTCARSPEVLFYIAIPSSLGLLPYLNTTIPSDMQTWVGYLFGAVFSAATVGAVLVARGRDSTDMEVASIVGALCFTAFSILVIVFVSFALVGGDIPLICVLAVIIAAVHMWAWAKK